MAKKLIGYATADKSLSREEQKEAIKAQVMAQLEAAGVFDGDEEEEDDESKNI